MNIADNIVVRNWIASLNSDQLNSFIPTLNNVDRTRLRIIKRRVLSDLVQHRVDYTSTTWGNLIKDPNVNDPTHRKGKVFRRRFRVPFPLFNWLLVKCEEHNLFGLKTNSSKSHPRIPLEIKLLCCLRLLGRGECADTIAELSEIGESTVNHLIHTFFKNFVRVFRSEYIYLATGFLQLY
jgi:hypothetical protein